MTVDAIMWAGLLLAGLTMLVYLVAVLIHPEKW